MPRRSSSTKPFAFFFNHEGLDDTDGEFIAQPSAADAIVNMHRAKRGEWSAYNQGYGNLGSALESGARIDSLAQYKSAAGDSYLLAAVNGKIKSLNTTTGAVLSELSTAFTTEDIVDFETFKGSVYAVSNGLVPQKWAGAGSMSAAGGWPVTNGAESYTNPTLVEQHANRLVFSGDSDYGSHVIISNDLAPETFTLTPVSTDINGAIIQVAPGDGENVTCMRSIDLPALGVQSLLIWKDKSVYALDGRTPATFSLRIVNKYSGCLNNRCAVQVGTDFVFLDEHNVYSLTTATQSGTLQPKAIGSRNVQNVLRGLNVAAKDKCWGVYLKDRDEVWFGICTGSNTEVDTILVYSLPRDEQEVNNWSIRNGFPSAPTCALLFDKTLFTGAANGFVNKWFSSSTYAGTGINYTYRYPFYNFNSEAQGKRIIELYAWFLLIGPETVSFKTEWRNGGNNNQKTIAKTISQATGDAVYGAAPGAGVYGTSYFSTAQGILVKQKLPVYGNGDQLQLTMSGTTGNTGPQFLGFSGLVDFLGYDRSYK